MNRLSCGGAKDDLACSCRTQEARPEAQATHAAPPLPLLPPQGRRDKPSPSPVRSCSPTCARKRAPLNQGRSMQQGNANRFCRERLQAKTKARILELLGFVRGISTKGFFSRHLSLRITTCLMAGQPALNSTVPAAEGLVASASRRLEHISHLFL